MKKALSLLLVLCLLAGLVPVTAGAAKAETLEGFLNQAINNGWLALTAEYDCEKAGAASERYVDYETAVHRLFSLPASLDVSLYGMEFSYDRGSFQKTLPLSDAKWLFQNILNWSGETWDGMLAQAQSSNGYIGKSKFAQVKDGRLCCEEFTRGANGVGVTVTGRRNEGSRLEIVFTCLKQDAPSEPVYEDGRYYGEVEQKTIDGKRYWTIYRARKLQEGEDPLARPTVGGFPDVFEGDYISGPVQWAVEQGITVGDEAGRFLPNAKCSRAQIVTFLWRAYGKEAASQPAGFTDLPQSGDYRSAISWAVENKITGGIGGGKFGVNAPCTRDQAVTFLWRAAGEPVPASSSRFADVSPNSPYKTAIDWAVENEITLGTGNNKFGAGAPCTRAEIVTFLYRALAE